MKGVVRSVHETLFGGCARVLTEDFVPVYREPIEGSLREWKLAVITGVGTDGRPTAQLCTEVVWVNAVALKKRYADGQLPTTGDTFTLDEAQIVEHKGLKRNEVPGRLPAIGGDLQLRTRTAPGRLRRDRWVLLVSDTRARSTAGKQHDALEPIPALDRHGRRIQTSGKDEFRRKVAGCWWAAGKLGGTPVTISQRALQRFEAEVEDADDRRKMRQETSDAEFSDVGWWRLNAGDPLRLGAEPVTQNNKRDPEVTFDVTRGAYHPLDETHWDNQVARRRLADGRLLKGDVIWVKANGSEVTDIKLAAAWRRRANAKPLGERLSDSPAPESRKACTDPEHLCLSCAIFGSADTTGDGGGEGQQRSYRGHVRFGAAVAEGCQPEGPLSLAPLSSPRPGAGQFYLENAGVPTRLTKGQRPGQWDVGPFREARGRKFYWHSNPDQQVKAVKAAGVPSPTPRHLQTGADGMRTEVRLLETGRLTQTVSFDGLDRLSVLTLLAAIDPDRVLDAKQKGGCALHLGGGKPYGLGTVTTTISDLKVTTVADRYLGENAPVVSLDQWTRQDRADLTARVGDLDAVHQAATHVLALHGLGDDEPYVTYPITVRWSQYGSPEFVRSFQFFADSSGRKKSDGAQPLPYVVLPDLTAVANGASPAVTNKLGNAQPRNEAQRGDPTARNA